MFGANGHSSLLSQALQAFMVHLGGLRDGDEQAIHQARVAIRRLREAAVLARAEYDEDEFDEVQRRVTRAFKALGRARDADTAQRLVQHVESRFTLALATLGALRGSVTRSQLSARRKVVKTLEAVEAELLPQHLERARRSSHRLRLRDPWRATLRNHIQHRAGDARQAIAHAGGVYFRKRSHAARVAVKQLRYALELADMTDIWRLPRAVRTLRKAQDALGQAHDREVLLTRLGDLQADGAALPDGEAALIEQFLAREIHELHTRYLAARPDILGICDACQGTSRRPTHHIRTVAVTSLAIPVVLALRRM